MENYSIKLIVLCSQNPDHNGLPHNSAILQDRLNLEKNIACIDISQGCAGYIYGLKVAESFLKDGESALFFTCDPYSKIIKDKDYKTELLFGDAATLTILSNLRLLFSAAKIAINKFLICILPIKFK